MSVITIETLKKRKDFVLARQQGKYASTHSLVVQLRKHAPESNIRCIYVGYTVTKKVGGAVVRNRIKRQLREITRELLPVLGKPGNDYVFIARHTAVKAHYAQLYKDARFALSRLHKHPKPASK